MHLTTARLILRDAVRGDSLLLSEYQSHPEYLKHYSSTPDAVSIVNQAIAWAAETPRRNYQLVIEHSELGLVIGCVGLRQHGKEEGMADVGIELAPKHWGKGYASEAIRELVRFGSSALNIRTIESETAPDNDRAHKLLESLGFTYKQSFMNQSVFQAHVNDD